VIVNLKPAIGIAIVAIAAAAPVASQADTRWRGDIRHFDNRDAHRWASGHWYHGNHDGRVGWWWVLGAATVGTAMWYAYNAPVYPYPDPYVPPAVIVAPPPASAPILQPAPPAVWYYCGSSRQYYPYVGVCPEGWKTVPAAPAGQ
jgi:hypothetical protein